MGMHEPLPAGASRILRIDKVIGDSIECHRDCHDLESPPEYSAISYTWGYAEEAEFLQEGAQPTDHTGCTVQVNGRAVTVTPNLFDLLTEFGRLYPSTINYWIDALCINQSDTHERMIQVNQMDQVYGKAFNVVVWLGKENSAFAKVHIMIKTLASTFPESSWPRT